MLAAFALASTLVVATAASPACAAVPAAAQSTAPPGSAADGGHPPVADVGRPADVEWVGEAPPEAAELAAHPEAHAERLLEAGLALDLAARTVSARGGTLHDAVSLAYPIEYVLVTDRGRTHEALFVIKAPPSLLDACLRAIGLAPGAPMRFTLKEPPPSEAEVEAGVSRWEPRPAYGPLVAIDVAWTDDEGRPHRAPLETLLADTRTGEPLEEAGWVFVGGRYGPLRQGRRVVQTHLPDLTGNVVATYLTGEGTSLLERESLEAVDDSLYTIHGESAPARGTPITLVFRATGAATAAPPAEPSDAVVAGERGERLDRWLAALVPWGFSGVALVEEGGVLLHRGYGLADRRTGLPVTTDTVFPWGSTSRLLVAVAVLQLAQRGELALDDPLSRHMEGLPEDKAPVTIRQLLEHRSGLPAEAPGADSLDRAAARRAILETPLTFRPGEDSLESAPGYALLVMLVEDVAEDAWAPYVSEHILGPARMTGSGLFGEPRWEGRRLARGSAGGRDVGTPADRVPTWAELGEGALIAPVRDFARLHHAIFDGTLLDDAQLRALLGLALGDGASRSRLPGFRAVAATWHELGVRGDAVEGGRSFEDAVRHEDMQPLLMSQYLLASNGEWEGLTDVLALWFLERDLPLPPALPADLVPGDPRLAGCTVRVVDEPGAAGPVVRVLAADGAILAESSGRDG